MLQPQLRRVLVSSIALVLSCAACRISTPLPQGVSRQYSQQWPTLSHPLWAPDGKNLLLTSQIGGEMIPEAKIYVLDVATQQLDLLLEAHNAYRTAQSWSPNGKEIAFAVGEGNSALAEIWVLNADGSGDPRFVGLGYLADWSPTGEQLAIAGNLRTNGTDWHGEIYILNLADGNKRVVFNGPDKASLGWQLAWSPDGTRLAFALDSTTEQGRSNSWDIYTLDLASGQLTQITRGGTNDFPAWSPDSRMLAYVKSSHAIMISRADGGCTVPLQDLGD